MSEQPEQTQKETPQLISEEIEVKGKELKERLEKLIQEGNVRRLIVRYPDGRVLLEIPLTAAAVGGVMAILAPWAAVLAGAAALMARVRIEIVREVNEEDTPPERLEKTDAE